MVSLRKEPLTFANDFFSYCSLQVQPSFKLQTRQFFLVVEGCFNILYIKFCLDHLFYATSAFVCFCTM